VESVWRTIKSRVPWRRSSLESDILDASCAVATGG
jgi:hypothetical protein